MANATKTASSQQKKKDNIIYFLIIISLFFNLIMVSLVIDLRTEMQSLRMEMQNLNAGITYLEQMMQSTLVFNADKEPVAESETEPLLEMDITPVAP
ncbi:hypothetical protein AN639_08005 [Candidatus Epulonipiscium fishelsonii]|uniref:Uncharacterized protein n=1 Tax=Candidatus Epulonipiscium fishelsonii TaxID=77094 RepID=A0ACC8X740_9FIRM|nr:hypothetical protein AN396_12715 [Epulopiscium sp. SCG-B11WGA-EpuloA1]ONI38332.1 hypothetical protein AN639_08005 [Epulopiscium sp. SCG-B05WGA-EpuloA1]